MTTNGSLTSTVDITQCPLCREVYVDPRVLPCCIHTFCLDCIEDWCRHRLDASHQSVAACPICARSFDVPPGGISELSRNAYIEQLVAELLSEEATENGIPAERTCQRVRRSAPDSPSAAAPNCSCAECQMLLQASSPFSAFPPTAFNNKTSSGDDCSEIPNNSNHGGDHEANNEDDPFKVTYSDREIVKN